MRRILLTLLALTALLSGCTIAITTQFSAGHDYDVFFNLPAQKQAGYLHSRKGFPPVCGDVFVAPRITLLTHEAYRLQRVPVFPT